MRHPSHFRSSCAPIFTALLLTVLLSPPPTRCATVSTPPPNATVLKLGVILPFTNVHFVDPLNYSNAYFETMQLAIDMISATSLLPADAYIQLDPRDSQDMVREGMSNALDLAKDGAIGLVGDITSGVTIGPALATGYLQIPICGSTATASDFDNKEKYPFFFRTIPSDQMHATAFLRIFQYYNWAQTAMMYDNSDYAKGIVTMFSALAAANDIRVLSIEQYYPKYYRPAIKSIAESKARIIIWVGNREDDLVDILPVARDAGLLAREYVWLAVEAALWAPAQMEPPDYHLLDGFIVSGSVEGDGPLYEQVLQMFTDRNMGTPYIQSMFVYDCIWAFAHIWRSLLDSQTPLSSIAAGNYSKNLTALLGSVEGFLGATGPVFFDSETLSRDGTYQVSNMRDGTATVLGNGTVRDTTLVLQTQATFRDGTHNVPADAPAPPCETYISTMSPFMTVLHSRVAFQVSQSGAMFTLVALGTLLVSLLIAFWFSVRLQFRDKVRAKWPSRVRKELVRGNLTNYLSLLFVAVETVQLCEFAFHVIPQWDTVARGATFLAGNFSVAWTFWVFGSAILLWNIFTLLILSNIAQRINQSSIGHILLYPAEALLPLLGTVGYVPATTTLLAPLGCRYTPAVARMSALCEVECWTSARHWSMSIIGAVLIDLFVPMNLVTRVVWQDIGKNEIKWDGLFFATDHLIKFLLVLWQAFLQDSNKTLYLGGIFVVNLLFAIGVFLTKPCNVPWMPLYRSLASLLASWVALIGWIFAGMSLNPDYVVPITIAGWVVIIVGGLYVSHRMYPAKFIKERRRTIGAIFKLFRAFNAAKSGSHSSVRSQSASRRSSLYKGNSRNALDNILFNENLRRLLLEYTLLHPPSTHPTLQKSLVVCKPLLQTLSQLADGDYSTFRRLLDHTVSDVVKETGELRPDLVAEAGDLSASDQALWCPAGAGAGVGPQGVVGTGEWGEAGIDSVESGESGESGLTESFVEGEGEGAIPIPPPGEGVDGWLEKGGSGPLYGSAPQGGIGRRLSAALPTISSSSVSSGGMLGPPASGMLGQRRVSLPRSALVVPATRDEMIPRSGMSPKERHTHFAVD